MIRRVTSAVLVVVVAGGCNDGKSSDSDAGTETSGSSTDSGSGSSTDSTSPTTGAPAACVPDGGPVVEAEFAARFAVAICAEKEACGCAVEPGCELAFKAKFAAIQEFAAGLELAFDAGCAGEVLAAMVEQRGCARVSAWSDTYPGCWSQCIVYTGEVAVGDACSFDSADSTAYANMCAGGVCDTVETGTCVEVKKLPGAPAGGPCLSDMLKSIAQCEGDTYCDLDTHNCEAQGQVGADCTSPAQCAGEAWCGPLGTCEAPKANGADCQESSECATQKCVDGKCSDFVMVCQVDSPSDLLWFFTL